MLQSTCNMPVAIEAYEALNAIIGIIRRIVCVSIPLHDLLQKDSLFHD